MQQSFAIHSVTEADLPALLALYRQCEDFLALGPVTRPSAEMVRADLRHSAEAGGQFYGIFEPEGRLMGVVDFISGGFEGNPQQAFLSLLMIAPQYRSKGLGTQVVRWFEAEVCRNGRVRAILSAVQVNNPQAVCFWERLGYQVDGGPSLQPDGTTTFSLRKNLRRKEDQQPEMGGECS